MSGQVNTYGKNIVADPAFVFRRAAREQLASRVGLAIGATYLWQLVASVAYGIVGFAVSLVTGGLLASVLYYFLYDPYLALRYLLSPGFMLTLLVSLLATLALSILVGTIAEYGLANLALRLKRGKEASLADAFGAFSDFGRVFLVAALRCLLLTAWGLIPFAGGVLSAIASYRYRFAYFVLIDDAEITAKGAIDESKRLTYGNKGRLFVQDCTFLGWLAACVAAQGVIFWASALIGSPLASSALIIISIIAFVAPYGLWSVYRETAAAAFYDQARSGSSTRDSANMSREGIAGLRQGDFRPSITAISGSYAGGTFRFEPDEEIVIGRDSALSDIILTEGAEMISRKHLAVRYDSASQVYIVVDHSSNGTYTDDGKQLISNAQNRLPRGSVLVVGSRANTIRLD